MSSIDWNKYFLGGKLDWGKLDWENVFGVVRSTDGMKRNQLKGLRAEVIEKAVAENSDGQLKYVGDTADGMDFEGSDGLRYECKSQQGMFLKTKPYTKSVVLKNHRSKKQEIVGQTFDYMILMDTTRNMVGICDWDACNKWIENQDADVKFRAYMEDITMLVKDVIPNPKLAQVNMDKEIGACIDAIIKKGIKNV